jgi:hypothetical protein
MQLKSTKYPASGCLGGKRQQYFRAGQTGFRGQSRAWIVHYRADNGNSSKRRSAAARARVLELVNQAKKLGVVQSALEQTGVKGVLASPPKPSMPVARANFVSLQL